MKETEEIKSRLLDGAYECAELVKNFICASQMIETDIAFTVGDFAVIEERINNILMCYDNAMAQLKLAKRQGVENEIGKDSSVV